MSFDSVPPVPDGVSVAGQFATAWKHTAKAPRVVRVYKIILPKVALDRYETYKYVYLSQRPECM